MKVIPHFSTFTFKSGCKIQYKIYVNIKASHHLSAMNTVVISSFKEPNLKLCQNVQISVGWKDTI